MPKKKYEVLEDMSIKLIGGPYDGIIYSYGRVQLFDEDTHVRISFEYNLKDGTRMDQTFINYIGPILTELLDEGLYNNSIVYANGKE